MTYLAVGIAIGVAATMFVGAGFFWVMASMATQEQIQAYNEEDAIGAPDEDALDVMRATLSGETRG